MNIKRTLQQATDTGNSITPSVLALARILGVEPKKLVGGLSDDVKNGEFLASVIFELGQEAIKQAKKEAQANNA